MARREELIGDVGRIWPSERAADLVELVAALDRFVGPVSREMAFRRKDGSDLLCVLTGTHGSTPDRMLLALTELSNRSDAGVAVEENLLRQAAVYKHMPIGLSRIDSSGLSGFYQKLREVKITDVEQYFVEHPEIVQRIAEGSFIVEANSYCSNRLGYGPPEEMIGRPVSACWKHRPDSLRQLLTAVFQ